MRIAGVFRGSLPNSHGNLLWNLLEKTPMPRLPFLPLIFALAQATAATQASTPADITITQALAQGTDVIAYVAVTDETGAPVSGITARQVHATLGAHPTSVTAFTPFAAIGEGVGYIFLVDTSRSLSARRFTQIRQALREWIVALGAQDRAALLSFGTTVQTQVGFTRDVAALTRALDALPPRDNRTLLHQALMRGLALGREQAEGLPGRRVIVTLSDGLDDARGGVTEAARRRCHDADPRRSQSGGV